MGRFEQIYEEHREALRAFVQRRAPESIVDDVVSETFLVCWRKLERIPDEPEAGMPRDLPETRDVSTETAVERS